jgi:hypothetical protein
MQRYIERFPAAGEIVIFDRSWYNRASVESVRGFATDQAVEIWSVPTTELAGIIRGEPPGLSVGKIQLDDRTTLFGVLGEAPLVEGRQETTAYGGWRAYVAAKGIVS